MKQTKKTSPSRPSGSARSASAAGLYAPSVRSASTAAETSGHRLLKYVRSHKVKHSYAPGGSKYVIVVMERIGSGPESGVRHTLIGPRPVDDWGAGLWQEYALVELRQRRSPTTKGFVAWLVGAKDYIEVRHCVLFAPPDIY